MFSAVIAGTSDLDECPSGRRSTPRKRVRAKPSASSNLASSAVPRGVHSTGFLIIKPKTARFQRFGGVSRHQAGLRRVAYRYMLRRILGDTLGAWWARAATPVRMIGNNFGPYMPWRDVWETGTLFRSACASCMPRHAKLNNIVGKQQLWTVPCGLRIPVHT